MENLKINGTSSIQTPVLTSKKEETKNTAPEMKKDGNKKLKLALAGLAVTGAVITAGVMIYKGHAKKAVKVLEEGVKASAPKAAEAVEEGAQAIAKKADDVAEAVAPKAAQTAGDIAESATKTAEKLSGNFEERFAKIKQGKYYSSTQESEKMVEAFKELKPETISLLPDATIKRLLCLQDGDDAVMAKELKKLLEEEFTPKELSRIFSDINDSASFSNFLTVDYTLHTPQENMKIIQDIHELLAL